MATKIPPLSAPALASRRKPIAGEQDAYSVARRALLAEEIDLRRRIDQVAEIRRTMPAGPILKNYSFPGGDGQPVTLSSLFREAEHLIVYIAAFGSLGFSPRSFHFLTSVQGHLTALQPRCEFAVITPAPPSEVLSFGELHHWSPLPAYQLADTEILHDLRIGSPDRPIWPSLLVLERAAEGPRLFWKSEMSEEMMDAGHVPVDAYEYAGIWSILDLLPPTRAPAPQLREDYANLWDQLPSPDGSGGRWPRPVYGIA